MLDINLSNVEAPSSDFAPMPEGKYAVAVTGAEVKDTKNKTGKYIKVEYTVLQGEYKGRKVWQNFNIKNPNPKAVEIGLQQLKDLLIAADSPLADGKLNSVNQLKGLKVTAQLKVTQSEEYGDKNEVHRFEHYQAESEVNPGVPNMAPQTSGMDDDLPDFMR